MSVLKYNNNGTWEGLNIDHASTADSALYDADGNVISSTYLPLSAGSDAPLNGDLYIDNNSGESKIVCKANGVVRGKVYTAGSTGNYPSLYVAAYNGSTEKSSLVLNSNDGYAVLGGNIVYIRPNGANSTTGQIYLGTDGQLRGGRPISESSNSTSRTLSNGGTLNLGSLNLPAGCSFGMQFGYVVFKPNASGQVQIAINGTVSVFYVVNGVSVGLSVSGLYAGSSSFSIHPLTSFGGTVSSSRLQVIWF